MLWSWGVPPDIHALNAVLKTIPHYAGLGPVSTGGGNPTLVSVQKRLLEIMRVLVAGADGKIPAPQAMGYLCGIARTTYNEIEQARKVAAVRGKTEVLERPASAGLPLLSDKERTAYQALAKSSSWSRKTKGARSAPPKYASRGRGRGRGGPPKGPRKDHAGQK